MIAQRVCCGDDLFSNSAQSPFQRSHQGTYIALAASRPRLGQIALWPRVL